MVTGQDFEKLLALAKWNGASFSLHFSDGSDEWSLEFSDCGEDNMVSIKRIATMDLAIERILEKKYLPIPPEEPRP